MLRHRKPFYTCERVAHVYCENCAEMVPVKECRFENIEEGMQGEDIFSGMHKICNARVKSFVILK